MRDERVAAAVRKAITITVAVPTANLFIAGQTGRLHTKPIAGGRGRPGILGGGGGGGGVKKFK